MGKVVLLEFVDEFEEFQTYIKDKGLNINDFKIIALEYKLQAYLKKHGTNFENTIPYFGNEAYKRILVKFDNILAYIENSFTFTDNNGVRNAYITELQYYLELIFNYIAKVLEILRNICIENNDIEFYVSAKTHIGKSVFISEDRFLGLLVERFAKIKGIKFCSFGDVGEQKNFGSFEEIRSKSSIIDRVFLNILKTYIKVFNKTPLLMATNSYGFEKLIGKIQRRNRGAAFVTFCENENQKWYLKYGRIISGIISKILFVNINAAPYDIDLNEQRSLVNKINEVFDSIANSVFEYCGIDFSDIIENKTKIGFLEHLSKMTVWSKQLKYIIKNFNIKIIISPYGRGIWYIAAELSQKLGIPSLFVSHGTHPVPTNRYHEISIFNMCRGFMLGDYSHIALSTPVQEAHLNYYKNKYQWLSNHEVIKTGPFIFADINKSDRLKNKAIFGLLPNEIVAVHAVSVKWRGAERYYFLETFDEYLAGLADIVDVVNKCENTKLIIRLHPGFDLSNEDMRLFLPRSNKYIISSTGPFSKVLSTADFLISYSSTTIDEALINKIPVLLYDRWNRYNHFGTSVYDTPESSDIFPVCYVNSMENLQSALEFMIGKVKSVKKKDIGVGRYKYGEDYQGNFYKFIEESLKINKAEVIK